VRRALLSAVGGAALAIAAHAGGLFGAVAPARAEPVRDSQSGSLVAFESDRDGDSEIYVVSDDGSGLRQLTRNKHGDACPTWTPDGQQIVFVSERGGNWDLYRMRPDGSNVVRLTKTHADEFDPVVSPDGRRIAFESNAPGNWDIFVMSITGGDQTNISRSERRDQDPTWAPDDSSSTGRVAFTTVFNRVNSDVAFAFVNAPGRVQTIVDGSTSDLDPNWSSADQIVFTRKSGPTRDLFVVNSDGSDLHDVSTGSTDDWGAVWADNGRIVFTRETDPQRRAEPYRIWVMDADGSNQHQLVQGTDAIDVEPAPQPGSNPRALAVRAVRTLAAASSHCKVKYGTDTPDVLKGTSKPDCLYGRGASDTIHGYAGGDPVIRGGPGADKLYAWQGDDRLFAVDGEPDLVRGGPGGDEAWVDEDVDTVVSAVIH
jgi:dipeptidyl aminopeptidase/acylaminoacyl peptidase